MWAAALKNANTLQELHSTSLEGGEEGGQEGMSETEGQACPCSWLTTDSDGSDGWSTETRSVNS